MKDFIIGLILIAWILVLSKAILKDIDRTIAAHPEISAPYLIGAGL